MQISENLKEVFDLLSSLHWHLGGICSAYTDNWKLNSTLQVTFTYISKITRITWVTTKLLRMLKKRERQLHYESSVALHFKHPAKHWKMMTEKRAK